jgi:uncharacterized protein with PQ loop repeat
VRKFFGILLIILGWFIALCAFLSVIPNIIKMIKADLEMINKVSFLVGTFIAFALLGILAYWIIRIGIRLTKKKKTDNTLEKIESIK